MIQENRATVITFLFGSHLALFSMLSPPHASGILSRQSTTGIPGPNELGKVLILEYHLIEPSESRWARSAGNFRADLEQLWQHDFRPIKLSDYVGGTIDLPSGKKPIVLTFDDSSPGQFRYIVRNGERIIDPDCAVGMLVRFHEGHPDFSLRAVFYVLPEAKEPHKLFGQPEYEGEKLKELDRLGFEIGNHTLWHARLDRYDDTAVQKQIALAQEAVRKFLPGYVMRSLSLPLGMYPRNHRLASEGIYNGLRYHNDAILLVAGPPAPSPLANSCNRANLPRIQVTGSQLPYWLKYFEQHPDEVFRSDGKSDEVTFPRKLLSEFDQARFNRLRVNMR